MHFNSHAHVERDLLQRVWNPMLKKISTHTLTWSVTPIKENLVADKIISTHTLTWSVTAEVCVSKVIFWDFNSHAHVERDSCSLLLNKLVQNFNSHAHVERDVGVTH